MDDATAGEAQAVVSRYRARARFYIIDTGRDLLAMKERLENDLFLRWVKGAMGLTPLYAQNYMQAASTLGNKSETVSHLPPTTLYKLAAPSTPSSVRDEIIRRLEAGEALTPRTIEGQLWTAHIEAKHAKADAKLAPKERKRRAEAKRASQERRHHEHMKWQAEQDEATAKRKAATEELASILVPLLSPDAYHRAYELFLGINAYDMREALAVAWRASGNGRPVLAMPSSDVDV